ncbi:hypothetical protein K503DRAFT_868825 [Rhizopogon vinicolor AM-OR11-026]|uniref:G-protein coupled receptors family 1 profile domain-containing protein n=1 Tax=Rhizopogon vinicolor AM-OR11-026 TaxID=1314800 RepID=A0A1B7MPS9_9AGAM|nr:hypothetical protein K503DRAFT_868825 [Rhizopogon vinicolor AM-OR11-026]
MALTIAMAQLLGVFLESLAHGVYLMVFKECIFVLRKRHSRASYYLVGTAVSLFILTTTHLFIDVTRSIQAFTSNMEEPYYPTIYYNMYNTWMDILKSILYVSVTLVSDAFILYRLFIVWDRNYFIVALPFLLFIADIVSGALWVYTLTLPPGSNVYASAIAVTLKVFYSMTLVMNVICTSLIALKILMIHRRVASYKTLGSNQLSRAVSIIVESCSLYSALLVVMITTVVSESPVVFIVLELVCPVIGIVFSSVIIRVSLGVSHGDPHHTDHSIASIRNGWNMRSHHIEQSCSTSPPDGGVQVSL